MLTTCLANTSLDGSSVTDCTIVIVTYNGWELTRECLAALESQRWPGIEVVIVDNGSHDGTPRNIRCQFEWVRVIEAGRNLGFAAANNLAIRQTDSPFVLLLNSDAIMRPGFLTQMLDTIETSDQLGSVAAAMVFHQKPGTVASAGIDVFANGLALDRSLGDSPESLTDRTPVFGASAGAAIYRRAALADVGLFPESFFMYLEDVDLAWRLRLRGWRSALAARAVAEHAYSSSSGEGSTFKRTLIARNRIWCIARCYPAWLLARNWPRMVWYDVLVCSSAPFRLDGASVRGRLAALAGMKSRITERASIQSRSTSDRPDLENWILPSPTATSLLNLRRTTRDLARRQ